MEDVASIFRFGHGQSFSRTRDTRNCWQPHALYRADASPYAFDYRLFSHNPKLLVWSCRQQSVPVRGHQRRESHDGIMYRQEVKISSGTSREGLYPPCIMAPAGTGKRTCSLVCFHLTCMLEWRRKGNVNSVAAHCYISVNFVLLTPCGAPYGISYGCLSLSRWASPHLK